MKTSVLRSALLLALASCALTASATVIDFEGVPGADYNRTAIIHNGYAGLNWDNFYVTGRGRAMAVAHYENGIVSGDFAAFNGGSEPATLRVAAGGPLITTFSGRFTAAYRDGEVLTVQGLLNGAVVATATTVLSTSGPATYGLTFAGGVDSIRFSTRQVGNDEFVLDDLRINEIATAVPGPVAALPFALMALKRRKRA